MNGSVLKVSVGALLVLQVWTAIASAGAGSPFDALRPAFEPTMGYEVGPAINPFGRRQGGFDFTPAEPIVVEALGIFDFGLNGLGTTLEVGLFDIDNDQQLSRASVPAGESGSLIGRFRYVAIEPQLLHAGVRYQLAGIIDYGREGTHEGVLRGNAVIDIGMASPLTEFQNFRRSERTSTVVAPADQASSVVTFGPNFLFRVVPEPSSGACCVAAVLMAGLSQGRRFLRARGR